MGGRGHCRTRAGRARVHARAVCACGTRAEGGACACARVGVPSHCGGSVSTDPRPPPPPPRSILGSTYSFVKTAQPIAVSSSGRLVDSKALGTPLHTMSSEKLTTHKGILSVGLSNAVFEALRTISFPAAGAGGVSTFGITGYTRATVNGTVLVRQIDGWRGAAARGGRVLLSGPSRASFAG